MQNLASLFRRSEEITVIRRCVDVFVYRGVPYDITSFPYPLINTSPSYIVAYEENDVVYFAKVYTTKRVAQTIDKHLAASAQHGLRRVAFYNLDPMHRPEAIYGLKNMLVLKPTTCIIRVTEPNMVFPIRKVGALFVDSYKRQQDIYLHWRYRYYALKFYTRHLLAESLSCLI